MEIVTPLALSASASTIGLLFVFAVLFPAIVGGLVFYSLAQVAREHEQNNDFLDRIDD